MNRDNDNSYKRLVLMVKEWLTLSIENVRLTAAEKVAVLLSTAVIALIGLIVAGIVCFFLSMCVARLLATTMPIMWAYAIVASFYLVLLLCVIVFRKALILNPIARFISKIFLS